MGFAAAGHSNEAGIGRRVLLVFGITVHAFESVAPIREQGPEGLDGMTTFCQGISDLSESSAAVIAGGSPSMAVWAESKQ